MTDIYVNAGANLQTALNAAVDGDVLILEAGAGFTGYFTLHPRAGTGWITITSSLLANLPAEGVRVSPADAANMPKIISPSFASPTLVIERGVNRVKFIGIEITTAYTGGTIQGAIIRAGYPSGSGVTHADNLEFDRCFIHGTSTGHIRDGITTYQVTNFSVHECYISNIHSTQESHGLQNFYSLGPMSIFNNFVEASGINLFFGDNSSPVSEGSLYADPQDVTVQRNHLFKPLSWKIGHPTYAGIPWLVKNMFEIKNGQRFLVEGNVLENSWPHGQTGTAFLLKNNTGPTEDITIRHNIIKQNCELLRCTKDTSAVNTYPMSGILVENNLVISDVNSAMLSMMDITSSTGWFYDLIMRHNTMIATTINSFGNFPLNRVDMLDMLTLSDNIMSFGTYGIKGNATVSGKPSLDKMCLDYHLDQNVWIRSSASPNIDVYFPVSAQIEQQLNVANVAAVMFTDAAGGDYSLAAGSPYKGTASGGTDFGVDWDALMAAQSGEPPPLPSELPAGAGFLHWLS